MGLVSDLVIVLFVAFVASQCAYFFVNLGVVRLAFAQRHDVTDADRPPAEDAKPLQVLVPLYREDRDVVAATLDVVDEADYPSAATTVHLIYDEGDEVVRDYARDLVDRYERRDLDVDRTLVQEENPVWDRIAGYWHTTYALPRTKARALTYALYTHSDGGIVQGRRPDGSLDKASIPDRFEGVVTVLDADTGIPEDLFAMGINGLEEYDIVQAKQTVRNHDEGWLPLLESMGIAAWSDLIYARTASGPYQLLGKGYFLEVETLYDVFGWDPEETTEDMALGVDAYAKGYTLGIADTYVQDLCPSRWRDWIQQKRRWVTGPYRALGGSDLTTREKTRFASYTLLTQVLPLVNLVGIPAGAYALYASLFGSGLTLAPLLWAIVTFNLVVWAIYTAGTYRTVGEAVGFDDGERVGYYFRSNPLTQVLYATLWAVPVLKGLRDVVAGRNAQFEVTPKSLPPGERDRAERGD